MKELTFVTGNPHKVADAKKLLSNFKIKSVDFDVPEIQSMDLREIASRKLEHAYQMAKQPCFVMDTGLYLNCLNGFPGPFIKWFFEDTVGADKTCEIASHFKETGCEWKTILGYFDGKETRFFDESVKGTVPDKPRGDKGYHWDVIFVPEGESRTLAEMSFEEKQSYAVTKKLLGTFSKFLETP